MAYTKTEDERGRQVRPLVGNESEDGSGAWHCFVTDSDGYLKTKLQFIADDALLKIGTDSDIVLLNRSTILAADAELSNVIVGTSVHPAIAANSLIASNITANGDILILASDGGDSKAGIFIDASVPLTYIYNAVLNPTTGTVFIGDGNVTAEAVTGITTGIQIDQGAADNAVLVFKSSDITHAMTDMADADTYGLIRKAGNATGGMKLTGYSSGEEGILLSARYTTDNTTKSTSGAAALDFRARKSSGASIGNPGADANIMVVRAGVTTVSILDEDGDLWLNGSLNLQEKANAEPDITGAGQFWVKTATPNTPFFTDDAGTDHQLLTGATGTKHEFHMPFEDPTSAVGNWDVVDINATQDTHFVFQVPEGFESLVNAKVVMIPDATETIQWDVNVSVAAAGETQDDDTRSAVDQTLAVTADQLTEVDISGQLSGLAGGDYVGIDFLSDTGDLRIIGFEFDYL